METTKPRGSELLKERYGRHELEELLNVASDIDGVHLADFFPIGIPDPDGGWGVWRVTPSSIGPLLEALLKHRRIPSLKVFPNGIPVEDLHVVFEAGSARRM